jgi:UDP-N-acetylmuramate dehydrogenase
MEITPDVSLKSLHTFGIEVKATGLVEVKSEKEFIAVWQNPEWKSKPKLILGGGSNVLFTDDYKGLIILNRLYGKSILKETEDIVFVKIQSGENWHELVIWTVEKGWGGIENLSLIPGTVGAAPMQNIGAYGVELKEVFESLEAINLETGKIEVFNKEACQFGYRESVFKRALKNKYFISSVTLSLSKKPQVNLQYGDIRKTLESEGIQPENATIKDVSKAVIKIRQQKLPDPKELGNAGSFFKNPIISNDLFDKLKEQYTELPGYPSGANFTKVPAAWLIEQSGWKGKRAGACGSHEKQALVIVNYGGAKGSEIVALAGQIQASVSDKFNIQLEPEVNFIS